MKKIYDKKLNIKQIELEKRKEKKQVQNTNCR